MHLPIIRISAEGAPRFLTGVQAVITTYLLPNRINKMPFTDYGHMISRTTRGHFEKVPKADGGDGNWHKIYRQSMSDSCGPTCVRMAIEMNTGKVIGEEYCRGLTALSELGISPSDQSALATATVAAHNFSARGLEPNHVLKAMKDMKADAWKAPNNAVNFRNHLTLTSVKCPAVVGYFWFNSATRQYSGAGGHYVVVAGPLPNNENRLLVLDPAYGLQHIELNSDKSAERYFPRQAGKPNANALARGKLDRDDAYFTHDKP